MFKFVTKYVDQQSLKASFAFAIIYSLMFNSSVIVYKFNHYNIGAASLLFMLARDFLFSTVALFVFFFGLTLHTRFFQVLMIILFISGAFASYHMYAYEATISRRLLTSFYENSDRILNVRLIVWMIFSLGVCYSAIKHFKVQTPPQFFTKLLCAFCLFLFVNCIISPPFDFLEDYFPTQFLNSCYLYFT